MAAIFRVFLFIVLVFHVNRPIDKKAITKPKITEGYLALTVKKVAIIPDKAIMMARVLNKILLTILLFLSRAHSINPAENSISDKT